MRKLCTDSLNHPGEDYAYCRLTPPLGYAKFALIVIEIMAMTIQVQLPRSKRSKPTYRPPQGEVGRLTFSTRSLR
jgi:hypothetical protein